MLVYVTKGKIGLIFHICCSPGKVAFLKYFLGIKVFIYTQQFQWFNWCSFTTPVSQENCLPTVHSVSSEKYQLVFSLDASFYNCWQKKSCLQLNFWMKPPISISNKSLCNTATCFIFLQCHCQRMKKLNQYNKTGLLSLWTEPQPSSVSMYLTAYWWFSVLDICIKRNILLVS